ncbi:MAG: fibrobacter succinogenes major paralogous domain-containing protein [Candidatus Marinimicrobia bacterium]|nr:fibrobacter succinogenes major paralogous domain-containing protein [Candidatus Neomarinimicrobiota bacterium]
MFKRILTIQAFILIIISQMVFAQDRVMAIHKNDGTYELLNVSDIDSLTFIELPTDGDGNLYSTIKIGNQWWMAENLKATKYRNGETIQKVTDGPEWASLNVGETPAYCAYDNNETNADTYGYMYNWYAVNDSRNIAPVGWHVPTDSDWQELSDFLGEYPGGILKETGTIHWSSPNFGASDACGFTALPGGSRAASGYFSGKSNQAYFWATNAVARGLSSSSNLLFLNTFSGRWGISVRCVRD